MIALDSLRCPANPRLPTRLKLESLVNLSPPGLIRVVGPNGAGKTTLLRIIAGLEADYTGKCHVARDDYPIRYVPTDANDLLMPWYSVAKNASVLLGRHEGAPASLRRFHGYLDAFFGRRADSFLNRPAYRLSAGERAAIACACALASRPSAILLDETLAHMGEVILLRTVRALEAFVDDGGLVLFVAHHLPSCMSATASVLLANSEET